MFRKIFPGPARILRDRLLQGIEPVVLLLVAQLLEEANLQVPPIKLLVAIEQMHLQQRHRDRVHRRSPADAGDPRAEAFDLHGKDAAERRGPPQRDVGGGKSQGAAQLRAVRHPAAEGIRVSQQPLGAAQIARARRAAAASREKNSRGCGSKVRTQEASFNSRAFAATRSMSARWPRCTPSKLPMVSAHRPRVACNAPCVTTMETVKILNYSVFMKTLEEQMAFYAAYHQDARNKATHFIGVPAIMLSLFIPLAWLRLELGGVAISAAMLFAAAVLVYYFLLDVPLALAMLLITGILVLAGERIAGQGAARGWVWFGVLFVGGWILQLVGHVFEGRKPALADNLFQIFVAPIFLCAELAFALGYKPELHADMQQRALRMRQK